MFLGPPGPPEQSPRTSFHTFSCASAWSRAFIRTGSGPTPLLVLCSMTYFSTIQSMSGGLVPVASPCRFSIDLPWPRRALSPSCAGPGGSSPPPFAPVRRPLPRAAATGNRRRSAPRDPLATACGHRLGRVVARQVRCGVMPEKLFHRHLAHRLHRTVPAPPDRLAQPLQRRPRFARLRLPGRALQVGRYRGPFPQVQSRWTPRNRRKHEYLLK